MIKVKSLRRLFSTPRTKGTLSLDSLYKNIESSEISSVCLGYVDILGRLRGVTYNPEIFRDFYLPQKQFKPIESIEGDSFLPGSVMSSNLFFNRHTSTFEVMNSEREEEWKTQKVFLHPDMSTARFWSGNKVLVLAHLYEKEQGGQFRAHPLYLRNKLIELINKNEGLRERQVKRAQLKFYLYSGSDTGSIQWTMSPDRSSNFYEIEELDRNSEVLEEMTYSLINSGIPVTSLQGDEGNSQFEISLTGECNLLEICDRVALGKAKLKEIAQSKKKTITTMALPYADQPGNSLRIEAGSPSKLTRKGAELLLQNLIFLTPNPNSFKRLKQLVSSAISIETITEGILSPDSLSYLSLPVVQAALDGQTDETQELTQFQESFPKKFEEAVERFKSSEAPYYGVEIRDLYSQIAQNETKGYQKLEQSYEFSRFFNL